MKELLALSATLLIVIAYVPYIKDVQKEKTQPHIYTWFVSGLLTLIAFGLQLSKDGGWGALPTFVSGVAGILIFWLSLKKKHARITKIDTFFFVLSLIAVALWLIADQPVISAILVSSANLLAFLPTIRKSWSKPSQETSFTYFVNTLRFATSVGALQSYSIVTVLYPASSCLMNGSIAIYLLVRKRLLKKQARQ